MDKTFDDLFNEFFKPLKEDGNNEMGNIKDETIKLMEMLKNLEDALDSINEFGEVQDEDMLNENLGEPDEKTYYEENGTYFEKCVWKTPEGELTKLTASPFPLDNQEPIEKTLEEQLEEAIANEDYETAAKLRDEIKNKK